MTDIRQQAPARGSKSGLWLATSLAGLIALIWFLDSNENGVGSLPQDATETNVESPPRTTDAARVLSPQPVPNQRDHAAFVNRGIEAPGLADLSVTILYDDHEPASAVQVFARKAGDDARLHAKRATTNADGMVHFGPVTPGRYKVWTDRNLAGHAEFRVIESNQVVHWTMVLPVANRVRVRVVNHEDAPVGDAAIISAPLGWRGEDATTIGRTRQDGTFEFATAFNPILVGARAHWFAASRMHFLESEVTGKFDITIRLDQPGGSVEGTVRDPEGQPIAGAVVRVGTGRLDSTTAIGQSGPPLPGQSVTDEAGRYLVVGIPVGVTPMTIRAGDFAPFHTECNIAHGAVTGKDIALTPGAAIEGLVRDSAGALLARALIECGEEGQLDYTRDVTDESGFYRLSGLLPGKRQIRGRHRLAGNGQLEFTGVAGETHAEDLVIEPGRVIEGFVLAGGKPVATAALMARQAGEEAGWSKTVYSEHDGRFRFVNVAPGDIRLSVRHKTIEAADRTVLATDRGPIEWSLELREIPTGAIVGSVVDSEDRPSPEAQVALNRVDAAASSDESTVALARELDGTFEFKRLRDGVYNLRVLSTGRAPMVMDYVVVEDGQVTDLGAIVPPAGHRVTIEVLPPADGQGPAPSGIVILSDHNLQFLDSQPVVDITAPIFTVAPGDYWLELRGIGLANQFVRRSVNGPTKVTFHATTGVDVKIRFAGVQKMSGPEEGLLLVQNEHGVAVRRHVRCGPDLPVTFSTRLAPGDYEVSYSIAKDRSPLEWSIRADEPAAELRIDIR